MYDDILGKKEKINGRGLKFSLEFKQDIKTLFGLDLDDFKKLENFLEEEFSDFLSEEKSVIDNAIMLLKNLKREWAEAETWFAPAGLNRDLHTLKG